MENVQTPTALGVELVEDSLACCTPICACPLSSEDAATLAPIFKALGDPTRLGLFSRIACCEEACVCDLSPDFAASESTISHHLKVLREAGLVTSERRGTWVYYRAVPSVVEQLSGLLNPAAKATPGCC